MSTIRRVGTGLVGWGVIGLLNMSAGRALGQTQPLPRYLTAEERAFLQAHPLSVPEAVTPPPVGPIHCVAEYEPMDAILLSWMAYSNIVGEMAARITTVGDADVYVAVYYASWQSSVLSKVASYGGDTNRVKFIVQPMNSVWIRDYGPRYCYEGPCRIIIDHTYNRPRPLDNQMPAAFGAFMGHRVYELPLIHGGGNFHLSALGDAYSTQLIVNENPGKTPQDIQQIWHDYQNLDVTITPAFPTQYDYTQHIDMWMQIIGDREVMINDYPLASGQPHDAICDSTAASLAAQGWTVHRIPALNVSGTHYTYANVTMCNDLVLVPMYTHPSVAPYNQQALDAWKAAVPGKTCVQINCESIVSAAGVMHCICMHIPKPTGGTVPTAYLQTLNGGQTLAPGSVEEITWISDDDEGVVSADLYLSTDGGATYPTLIASGEPGLGTFQWTVPNIYTTAGRIKVVVRDAAGNTGSDTSDADFTIGSCPPDCDGNGTLELFDFLCFTNAFNAGDPYADCDGNGTLDLFDFLCFTNTFNAGCP